MECIQYVISHCYEQFFFNAWYLRLELSLCSFSTRTTSTEMSHVLNPSFVTLRKMKNLKKCLSDGRHHDNSNEFES